MSNAGIFLEIYFIAICVTAAFASCLRSITCPCGSSKVNYTHCIDAASHEKYSCERWANCETCKANSMNCATCPTSRFGPTCTEVEQKITKGNHVLFGSCPHMKDIVNGQATCIRKENLRQCRGSCLPGHSFAGMEGALTITLMCTSKVWVPLPQFPPCKPKVNRYCNLRMTGPNQAYCMNKEIRRYCDITCDGKFQGRYSCSPGQTWTPPLPYCVHPTDCQDPGIPEGANRTNVNGFDDSIPRTYQEGESVHFSCKKEDSIIHGPETITCGANATWSDSLPQCDRSLLGTRATVTCPDPGVPQNGNRMNANGTDASHNQIFKEGRTLRFACRENIDVYGTTLITCRSDGTWSGSPPICNTPLVDTVCSLRVDGVGIFNCTRVTEGTSCDITCDGKLMGRFNCFDEDWFPRLPYCTSSKAIYRDPKEEEKRAKASCPDPETHEGAQRKYFAMPPGSDLAIFTEGESVVFYCDEDHKSFFITCQSDGTWSEATGEVTRCISTLEEEIKDKTCPDPGIPKSVNRMYTNRSDASHRRRFEAEESVVFDCKQKDLALQGANLITCKSNGKWSAPLPRCNSCEAIRGKGFCADPGIPEGGGRRNTDGTDASSPRTFTEGESVMFYCRELELALEGPRYSTCRSDGTWSESLPKCNIESYAQKFCGLKIKEANSTDFFECAVGAEGSRCNITCGGKDQGHFRCFPGKKWTPDLPNCVYPKLLFLDNSGNVPCPDPGLPKGGNRLNIDGSDASYFGDFQAGDTLMFSCNNDLALQGHSIITCRSNGTWSGMPPTCAVCSKETKKNRTETQFSFGSCPHIKSPVLGTIFCQQEGSQRYCTASCFPGYFFETLMNMVQIILICDGESWRPLQGFPPCKPAAGCSLRMTSHGKFNCSSDADGTHCDVRCGFDNYQDYQGLHHCNEKGEWSPSLPYCFTPAVEHEKALCLDPGIPEGATRTTVNGTDASTTQMFEEGESLNFTCKEQHLILEGSHIITCRSDSRWSASRPQCIRSPSEASGSSTVHRKVPGPFPNGHLLILMKIFMFHILLKLVSSITVTVEVK